MKFRNLLLAGMFVLMIGNAVAEPIRFPKMKSGDWESVMTVEGMSIPGLNEPKRMIYCLGDKQQEEMVLQLSEINQPGCDKPVIKQTGNRYLVSVNCDLQGMVMKISSELNIVNDAEIKGTAKMESSIGMSMSSQYSSRYKGPCAQGRMPGDLKELS